METAKSVLSDAIRLLGNASANILHLMRKKILKALNPDIQDLADEDIFRSVAPNLFSQGFELKMKERAKSVKLLSAAKPQPSLRKIFPKGRPTAPHRGGSHGNRGGKSGRRTSLQPGSNPPTKGQVSAGQRPSICVMQQYLLLSECNKNTLV